MSSGALPGRKPRLDPRDRWIPIIFVAFCLVVLGANATMIVIAFKTFTGVETQDAYRKGIGYNAALAAAREQAALGWRAELAFKPLGAGQGRIEIRLQDAQGNPVPRADVEAELVRPAQAGHDFVLPLSPEGTAYAAETAFPMRGVWDVRLRAESGRRLYRSTRRIMVP